MKRFPLIFLLSLILVGCNTFAPAATATATPRPTATVTPTAMPTATPTERPISVTEDIKEALGETYRVENDGSVVDVVTGEKIPVLKYLTNKKMQMAYEFEGDKYFKFSLNPEYGDIKVLENGDLDLPGWVWSREKQEMIRQRYSRAEGYNGIYADENDTQGEILYNVAEVQKILMKTDELDMSEEARTLNDKRLVLLTDCRVFFKCSGEPSFNKDNLGKEKIVVDLLGWWSKIVLLSKTKWTETTGYLASGVKGEPVSLVTFEKKDGSFVTLFVDMDDLVPDTDEPNWDVSKPWDRPRWSKYAGPIDYTWCTMDWCDKK